MRTKQQRGLMERLEELNIYNDPCSLPIEGDDIQEEVINDIDSRLDEIEELQKQMKNSAAAYNSELEDSYTSIDINEDKAYTNDDFDECYNRLVELDNLQSKVKALIKIAEDMKNSSEQLEKEIKGVKEKIYTYSGE